MNENKSPLRKILKLSIIYKFLSVMFVALSVFCIFLVILYTVGNYQNFQDSSQRIILKTISYVSIFLSFIAVPLFIENVIHLVTGKNKIKYIFSIIALLIVEFVCILLVSSSSTLSFLSMGIRE